MFVLVRGNDDEILASVEDPGNFKQLHAEFRGISDEAAAAALAAAGLGTLTAITPGSTSVRCAPRATAPRRGPAGFDGMSNT